MGGLISTEQMQTGEVVVCLKRKLINEKVLKSLKSKLEEMFPGEKVIVGLGRDQAIKLRNWGDVEEKKIRRLVTTLGGKINRR